MCGKTFDQQVVGAVSLELRQFRGKLADVGLSFSEPVLVDHGPAGAEPEIELFVKFCDKNGNIVDLFEFCVRRGAVPVVVVDEVTSWVRENLPDVVRRRQLP